MDRIIRPGGQIAGVIEVPGDKSITHRALIFGSLCDGDVLIENLSTADDCAATRECLQALGVEMAISGRNLTIKGKGLTGLQEPKDVLDARNSGTTIRLLTGLAAGQSFYTILTGDDSLKSRPMKRVIEPLRQMGAVILARKGDTLAPITISGRKLNSINLTLPVASAQVKTAILLASIYSNGTSTIVEQVQTRDHSERMLRYLGAELTISGNTVAIRSSSLKAKPIFVPGDISSAMFFIVAGLLLPESQLEIRNVGLNPSRMGAIDVLTKMGANIEIQERGVRNDEPYGDIRVRSTQLRGITIGREEIPSLIDEIPILALAATQAQGRTVISGAEELRVKESDRLHGVASQLNKMGADITEVPDGLLISGGTALREATVESFGDHRLEMTMAIAGLVARGSTTIRNATAAKVSFPEFYEILKQIGCTVDET
jgi:3-phosphoshikimate 1-carboxyvinyltransferase